MTTRREEPIEFRLIEYSALKKLEEENEKLLKSNIEMSDLIYAEDGYVESQNVLMERIEKLLAEKGALIEALKEMQAEVAELRDAIKECVSQLEWLNKPEPYLSTNVVLKRMYKLLGRDRV